MSTSVLIDSPDSLQTLLDKANAIKTVNQENLEFIKSRQGHDVIKKYKYSLQIENPKDKKGEIYDALKVVTNKKN